MPLLKTLKSLCIEFCPTYREFLAPSLEGSISLISHRPFFSMSTVHAAVPLQRTTQYVGGNGRTARYPTADKVPIDLNFVD